jgi:prolyl 4-hydroxylase
MKEVDLGGEKSFIGAWYMPDIKVCDELIEYFRRAEGKVPGQIGHDLEVNKDIKDSLDLHIAPNELSHPTLRKYVINLVEVAQQYKQKYVAAGLVKDWGITENVQIQYYQPMGGYKEWHCERIGKMLPSANRHLVFMTYLNDLSDEGGTEFFYQGIKAEPRKGLTLIWPVDWTHLHRGVVSPTQEKYIITGWFDFL